MVFSGVVNTIDEADDGQDHDDEDQLCFESR